MKCKNCGHRIYKAKTPTGKEYIVHTSSLGFTTKEFCGFECNCADPEPENKKSITQILSEIQEWKEVE